MRGIDVSNSQGNINWNAVKDSGVEFAIIRLGWGGNYSDQDDPLFAKNVSECERLNIPWGTYIYSYALNLDAVTGEIEHSLRMLKGKKPALGVWFDMEDLDHYKANHGLNVYQSRRLITDMCIKYCETMKKNGYDAGIYANQDFFEHVMYKNEISKYPFWLAYWASQPYMSCKIWQSTSKGKVPGISGNVDMDTLYGEDNKSSDAWVGIRTFTKGKKEQLSKNFVSTEFDCHGKGCCNSTPIDKQLIDILQNVRSHFNRPVNVNCGYRCPTHNSQVSGASKTSQHMSGRAADIVISGLHPITVARYIETIPGYKGMIGCYTWDDSGQGFVHVDTRGTDYRGIYTEDNAHCDYINSFNICIREGNSGRIVKVIQRRLQSHKMYGGAIDGKCGPKTKDAIIAWNAKYGRKNDAVWGPLCWKESFDVL